MPVALVTGGSSGIGKATAVAFAQAGYDVGLTYVDNETGAKEVAEEIRAEGREAASVHLDLEEPPNVVDAVEELIEQLGGVDVYVNNAGTGATAPFLEHSLEEWQRVLNVDLTGAFLGAQVAARRMVQDGIRGRIINITSVHEHVPLKGSSAYCAAKGGLGLLTKVMALELAEHGITVNSIAPGEIATKMTDNEDTDPHTQERPKIPAGRPGYAREIADFVVFLASPQASYATGGSFVVDGGLTLMAAVANQDS
ncbi:MAG: SDR family oxidoreductase [Actinomycetota bacterium]|nr:SDR family oxidoreductase [Actinomycetota bacterium]